MCPACGHGCEARLRLARRHCPPVPEPACPRALLPPPPRPAKAPTSQPSCCGRRHRHQPQPQPLPQLLPQQSQCQRAPQGGACRCPWRQRRSMRRVCWCTRAEAGPSRLPAQPPSCRFRPQTWRAQHQWQWPSRRSCSCCSCPRCGSQVRPASGRGREEAVRQLARHHRLPASAPAPPTHRRQRLRKQPQPQCQRSPQGGACRCPWRQRRSMRRVCGCARAEAGPSRLPAQPPSRRSRPQACRAQQQRQWHSRRSCSCCSCPRCGSQVRSASGRGRKEAVREFARHHRRRHLLRRRESPTRPCSRAGARAGVRRGRSVALRAPRPRAALDSHARLPLSPGHVSSVEVAAPAHRSAR